MKYLIILLLCTIVKAEKINITCSFKDGIYYNYSVGKWEENKGISFIISDIYGDEPQLIGNIGSSTLLSLKHLSGFSFIELTAKGCNIINIYTSGPSIGKCTYSKQYDSSLLQHIYCSFDIGTFIILP